MVDIPSLESSMGNVDRWFVETTEMDSSDMLIWWNQHMFGLGHTNGRTKGHCSNIYVTRLATGFMIKATYS